MKIVGLFLALTFSSLTLAESYTLRLEREEPGKTTYAILYEGNPTHYSLVDSFTSVWPVATHTVRIFRSNESGSRTEMANSQYRIFDETDGTRSVAAMSYQKIVDNNETKGFGSLVWELALTDPRVREIRADLDFDNYRELQAALGDRPATNRSLSDLVPENSHFGRLMRSRAFHLDPSKTSFDSRRGSVHVEFVREGSERGGGFLRWCLDSFTGWLSAGH